MRALFFVSLVGVVLPVSLVCAQEADPWKKGFTFLAEGKFVEAEAEFYFIASSLDKQTQQHRLAQELARLSQELTTQAPTLIAWDPSSLQGAFSLLKEGNFKEAKASAQAIVDTYPSGTLPHQLASGLLQIATQKIGPESLPAASSPASQPMPALTLPAKDPHDHSLGFLPKGEPKIHWRERARASYEFIWAGATYGALTGAAVGLLAKPEDFLFERVGQVVYTSTTTSVGMFAGGVTGYLYGRTHGKSLGFRYSAPVYAGFSVGLSQALILDVLFDVEGVETIINTAWLGSTIGLATGIVLSETQRWKPGDAHLVAYAGLAGLTFTLPILGIIQPEDPGVLRSLSIGYEIATLSALGLSLVTDLGPRKAILVGLYPLAGAVSFVGTAAFSTGFLAVAGADFAIRLAENDPLKAVSIVALTGASVGLVSAFVVKEPAPEARRARIFAQAPKLPSSLTWYGVLPSVQTGQQGNQSLVVNTAFSF